ncbi:MAG: family 43 glycosylhydrolase [Ginsengibacter sp.]
MKNIFSLTLFLLAANFLYAQKPIVPGYYADPSIKKFGDTYYMCVTTDGYPPFGNDGQTFVWTSDNLADWKPEVLKGLPNETIWAPAIIAGKNGKFYLYLQNSIDYSGYVWVGDSLTGPFTKANHLGGFDLEPFLDPVSKKIYVISATKELFEMDNDVNSPTYLTKIVKHIPLEGSLFDFTEGPYMFYRDGLYYAMWSGGRCWQKSYNVRYAISKNIEGPYTDGKNNPIIQTDEKAGIIGPGHHSVIQIDGRYFIFYHREDTSRGGPNCNYRLTCVSEISFNKDGEIHLVKYVDDLAALLGKKSKYINLALHKDVFANTESGNYVANNAVDGDNGTRWSTEANQSGILSVDLGSEQAINAVEIDFEYADKWQLFKVEYSSDNQNWQMLEDHSQEAIPAYKAMFINKDFKARYLRLSILNSEDRSASIWEFKALQLRK